MKTLENLEEVQAFGAAESKVLTISANAKAFKELISGIYSDKYLAITRELFSNAYDSHVEAGVPEKPFEVHAPTAFEPHFSVRDYGVSMDHQTVMGLYSQLFSSTKDDPNSATANNYVGKFGLGSKTPFAYTDAFQLSAFKGGKVRRYDIFINKGVPTISLFSEQVTDEPDGVLVSFPVEREDTSRFHTAISKAIEAFDVLPVVKGTKIDPPDRGKVFLSGDNWELLIGNTYSNTCFVRQGTVIYPLDLNQLDIARDSSLTIFHHVNFKLTVPIGTVEVSTSRESLSYDQRTISNLESELRIFEDEVKDKIQDELSGATSYYDFCKKAKNFCSNIDYRYSRFVENAAYFRGKRYRPTVVFKHRRQDVCMSAYRGYEVKNRSTFSPVKNVGLSNNLGYRTSEYYFKTGNPITIVLEDSAEKLYAPMVRFKQAVGDRVKDARQEEIVVWVRGEGDLTYFAKRILAKLGKPEHKILHLRDYEPPSRKKKEKQVKTDGIELYSLSTQFDYWQGDTKKKVDTTTDAYYLKFHRKDLRYSDLNQRDLRGLYQKLVNRGVIDSKPIYAVTVSDLKYLKHLPNLVHLYDLIKEKQLDIVGAVDIKKILQNDLINGLGVDCDGVPLALQRVRTPVRPTVTNPAVAWEAYEVKQGLKRAGLWEAYSLARRMSFDRKNFKPKSVDSVIELVYNNNKNWYANRYPDLYKQHKERKKRLKKILLDVDNRFPLLRWVTINPESLEQVHKYLGIK